MLTIFKSTRCCGYRRQTDRPTKRPPCSDILHTANTATSTSSHPPRRIRAAAVHTRACTYSNTHAHGHIARGERHAHIRAYILERVRLPHHPARSLRRVRAHSAPTVATVLSRTRTVKQARVRITIRDPSSSLPTPPPPPSSLSSPTSDRAHSANRDGSQRRTVLI